MRIFRYLGDIQVITKALVTKRRRWTVPLEGAFEHHTVTKYHTTER